MIRRPPRSTLSSSSAASDVYKRQGINAEYGGSSIPQMLQALTRATAASSRAALPRFAPVAFQIRGFADSSFLSGEVVTERVLETLKLVEKVDASKLSADAHFKNDLGLDSLDVVEVVMAIEEEFMVEIPDADAEQIQTCKEAINYIVAHPQAK
eukprot:TRINITY_DN9493_c0_g1_i1.p1 TRINITY_DN9493_c0_g1~~TRINITY_DN9493_c0_g1_i1.p1  ORF type:complete len:154 (+),score=47.19 TRINITY_DN9493_c0_g1_i1:148-609(+)